METHFGKKRDLWAIDVGSEEGDFIYALAKRSNRKISVGYAVDRDQIIQVDLDRGPESVFKGVEYPHLLRVEEGQPSNELAVHPKYKNKFHVVTLNGAEPVNRESLLFVTKHLLAPQGIVLLRFFPTNEGKGGGDDLLKTYRDAGIDLQPMEQVPDDYPTTAWTRSKSKVYMSTSESRDAKNFRSAEVGRQIADFITRVETVDLDESEALYEDIATYSNRLYAHAKQISRTDQYEQSLETLSSLMQRIKQKEEVPSLMGATSVPNTLSAFLNKLGNLSGSEAKPTYIPFTFNEQGLQFIFDMFKTTIAASLGEEALQRFSQKISTEANIVRETQSGTPLGILFKIGPVTSYLDIAELSKVNQLSDRSHSESWTQANNLALNIYNDELKQIHLFERITLAGLSHEKTVWLTESQGRLANVDNGIVSLFVISEIQDWKRKGDIHLRPDQTGSEEFQRMLFLIREMRPELFSGVVGIGGTGTGIDSILAIQFGATEIKGSELYYLMHVLSELNISFAKETGQIPESVPVEIELKEGIPMDPAIRTLIFNLPGVSTNDQLVTFQPANVSMPAKVVPSTGALSMTEKDLRKVLGQVSELFSGVEQRRAILRLDMQPFWGSGTNASDYFVKLEEYLKEYGLSLTGYYGGDFIEIQATEHASLGKLEYVQDSARVLAEQINVFGRGVSQEELEGLRYSVSSFRWFIDQLEQIAASGTRKISLNPQEIRGYNQLIEEALQLTALDSDTSSEARPVIKVSAISDADRRKLIELTRLTTAR